MNENEDLTKIETEEPLNNENHEKNKDNEKPSAIQSVFEWMDSFVASIIIVILLFTLCFGKVEVSGDSMNNTLHNSDQLIITGYNYTPQNGDIVIISRNSKNSETYKATADKPLVKRIIATEGQTIELKDGEVFVNGKQLSEDYAITPTPDRDFVGKHTVPKGCVFVMGDNRSNSADSRLIGYIDKNYILGKVLCRIYPFDSVTTF